MACIQGLPWNPDPQWPGAPILPTPATWSESAQRRLERSRGIMARTQTTSEAITTNTARLLMTTNATPPSWAELALRAFLSERDFESASGDLLEEYRENIYGNRGQLRADVWYVAQVFGFAWRHAGVWAVIFAVAFLARTAMDWHMPTA